MYFSSSSALLLYSFADFILYSFWSCKIQAKRSYGIAHTPTFGPVSKFWSHCIYPMRLQTVEIHCTRVIDKSSVCFCVINDSPLCCPCLFVHLYNCVIKEPIAMQQHLRSWYIYVLVNCICIYIVFFVVLQNSIAVLVVVTTALAGLIYEHHHKCVCITLLLFYHCIWVFCNILKQQCICTIVWKSSAGCCDHGTCGADIWTSLHAA